MVRIVPALAAVVAAALVAHGAPSAQAAQKGKAKTVSGIGSGVTFAPNPRGTRRGGTLNLSGAQQAAVRRLFEGQKRGDEALAKRTQEGDGRLGKRLSNSGKGKGSKKKANNDD